MKKYLPLVAIIGFFVALFFLSLRDSYANIDLLFDIVSGHIILQHGITHVDYLSYITAGREWYPSQWLFQLFVYLLSKNFGIQAIVYFTSLCELFFIAGCFFIFRYAFKLSTFLNLVACFLIAIWTTNNIMPRPGLLALGFLIWNLFFILFFLIQKKNYLWATLPLTFIWTNIHGSMILDIYLFAAYTLISSVLFLRTKEHIWKRRTLILGTYTLGTFLITVGPPLWTTQYRLLLLFQHNSKILTNFISEWMPLLPDISVITVNGQPAFHSDIGFWLWLSVTGLFLMSSCLWLFMSFRQKSMEKFLYMLPLVLLLPLPYSSIRHQFMCLSLAGIIISYAISQLSPKKEKISIFFNSLSTRAKIIISILVLIQFPIVGLFWYFVSVPLPANYPEQAVSFVLKENLQGNIYNDIDEGGYFDYKFYPQKKVFADGRLDLFFCCEFPMLYALQNTLLHNPTSTASKKFVDSIMTRYNISYAVLHYKNPVPGDISTILHKEKQWKLVYWDDQYVIYIKDDGKNNDILKRFGVTIADPFGDQVYPSNQRDLALKEYKRMAQIADSAVTEVGIAKIALDEKNIPLTKGAITKAIRLQPEIAKIRLLAGETYFQLQDYQNAIMQYQKTIELDKTQTLAYIRLGALYTSLQNTQKAREVLLEGQNNSSSERDKEGFQRLIDQVNSLQ